MRTVRSSVGSSNSSVRGNRSRATAIDGGASRDGWLAMLVWTMVFVVRYGFNLPAFDEWAFVKISYARGRKARVARREHMEHRFPMARLVFLLLLESRATTTARRCGFRSGCSRPHPRG